MNKLPSIIVAVVAVLGFNLNYSDGLQLTNQAQACGGFCQGWNQIVAAFERTFPTPGNPQPPNPSTPSTPNPAPGTRIDLPNTSFDATVRNTSEGGAYVSTITVLNVQYRIYNKTNNTGYAVPGRPDYVAVAINSNDDTGPRGPGPCTGNPNLRVQDIYFVEVNGSATTTVDENNLDIDTQYIPHAVIRNTSCRSTASSGNSFDVAGIANGGSFPVRLAIDFNNADATNPIFESYDQVNFVGPLGGNQSIVVAFPPITFTNMARHVLRVRVDPIGNQGTLLTCNPSPTGIGCVRETNEFSDNSRDLISRTTPPSVTVGSFLWDNTVSITGCTRWQRWSGTCTWNQIHNRWRTTNHLIIPERDIATDPVHDTGGVWSEIAIYWIGNKVNLDQCSGVGINNDRRSDPDRWRVSSHSSFTNRPFWAGQRGDGSYSSWPMGMANYSGSWIVVPVRGTVQQQVNHADNRIVWQGSETYHRTMDVFVNRGGPRVESGNFHQFTVTCPANNGSVVADTHIVRNGPRTTPLVLVQASLPDIEVNGGEVLPILPFSITNIGPDPIPGLSYTLQIAGNTVFSVSSSSVVLGLGSWNPRPVVNWLAPNASTTVPTRLCVTHPNLPAPVCDTGRIIVKQSARPLTCDAFTIDQSSFTSPASTTIRWNTTNADFVVVTELATGNSFISDILDGSDEIYVSSGISLKLTAFNSNDQKDCPPITVTVGPTPPTFTATPTTITSGGTVTTSWNPGSSSGCVLSPSGNFTGTNANTPRPSYNVTLLTSTTLRYSCTGFPEISIPINVIVPDLSFSSFTIDACTVNQINKTTGQCPTTTLQLTVLNSSAPVPSGQSIPYVIQQSINGGVTWTTISTANITGGLVTGATATRLYTMNNLSLGQYQFRAIVNSPVNTGIGEIDFSDNTSRTLSANYSPALPVVTITSNTPLVRNGGTATITWTIVAQSQLNVSCTLTGPGMPTTVNAGGTRVSGPLTNKQTFIINCAGGSVAGMPYGAVSAAVTVEVVPPVQEV